MIIRILLGVLIGGGIGAVLGYFGKCFSGTCPLTSNPYRGAIYGAVIGALLASALTTRPMEKPESSDVVHIENESDSNLSVPSQISYYRLGRITIDSRSTNTYGTCWYKNNNEILLGSERQKFNYCKQSTETHFIWNRCNWHNWLSLLLFEDLA